MNDKDKEAFEKWMKDEDRHDGVFGNNNNFTRDEWVADKAWQAACEYKQKEIDERDAILEQIGFNYEGINYKDEYKKLQAENAKLKEALVYIAKVYDRPTDMKVKARHILAELDKDNNDK